MDSTRLNTVIETPLRLMATLLIAATLWAANQAGAEAEPHPSLNVVAPTQAVVIGDVGALFQANVLVGADGHACGSVRFDLRDGTIIELRPLYAIRDPRGSGPPVEFDGFVNYGNPIQHGSLAVVLIPAGSSPTGPDDLVIATVQRDYERGEDIWDFVGGTMSGGTNAVPFDAQTDRLLSDEVCGPADHEQLDVYTAIHASRQTVIPSGSSDPLDFSADVRVERNHAAHGTVYTKTAAWGGLYQIFFGMVLPTDEGGSKVFLVGVRPDTPEVPDAGEDFLRVVISASSANPDCQIWDLVNGDTGAVQHAATVEVETDLTFSKLPGPGAAKPSLNLLAPTQAVVIGEFGAVFEAKVITDAASHACGWVNFRLRDGGTSIELQPVYGSLQHRGIANSQFERQNLGTTLVLRPTIGPVDPNTFTVATVQPATEVGCDIWDFTGGTMSGGTNAVPFDAETQHLLSDEVCGPADLGQLDSAVGIQAPRQAVTALESGEPIVFSANAHVERDNSANGTLYVEAPDWGGLYKIFYGLALPHPERDFQLFLVGERPDGADFSSTDDLVRAIVTPTEDDPDSMMVELFNGANNSARIVVYLNKVDLVDDL